MWEEGCGDRKFLFGFELFEVVRWGLNFMGWCFVYWLKELLRKELLGEVNEVGLF